MWKSLRLRPVFWLGALLRVMTLLVAVIASNLRDVSLKAVAITLLLFLALYSLSGIGPRCGSRITILGLFLNSLLSLLFPLLFLPGLVGGLGSLLKLAYFALNLWRRAVFLSFFRLFISVPLHLFQQSFILGVTLI